MQNPSTMTSWRGVKWCEMLLPHIQSPLFCLHQRVSWKDTHCPHKIHAPLDGENGSCGECSNMIEMDQKGCSQD